MASERHLHVADDDGWHLDELPPELLDDPGEIERKASASGAPDFDAGTSTGTADEWDDTDRDPAAEAEAVRQIERNDAKDSKKSISSTLVELALERYDFGMSDLGHPFALPKSGPKVVAMLRGSKRSLRSLLAREHFELTGKAAPQQALADALLVLEGVAQDRESTLDVRVATHAGASWLDLGDQTGAAVRIGPDGWQVVKDPPVLFRRTTLSGPLPIPERGGTLADLWRWLNVTEQDRPLVAAWLAAALIPDMPHPVMDLSGEQGTGKSTAAKVLATTIDPGPVPIRKPPRDDEALVTAAAGSWLVALDNITSISTWLADALCRACTGEGDVRRALYTDGDFAVFSYRRCMVLTGIDHGSAPADLAERMLPIRLEPIPDNAKREEREMWPRWAEDHPRILGAVLDLAAGVIHLLPSVELVNKPRMADYARVLVAVDQLLGTAGLDRYRAKQGELATESLTGDAFVQAIFEHVIASFEGSSADLLAEIPAPDRPPKGWPRNARDVTQVLRRQGPAMRKAGWQITDTTDKHTKTLRWSLTPTETVRNPDPPDPQDPQPEQSAGVAGVAGVDCKPSTCDEIDVDAWERDYPEMFNTSHTNKEPRHESHHDADAGTDAETRAAFTATASTSNTEAGEPHD